THFFFSPALLRSTASGPRAVEAPREPADSVRRRGAPVVSPDRRARGARLGGRVRARPAAGRAGTLAAVHLRGRPATLPRLARLPAPRPVALRRRPASSLALRPQRLRQA